MKKYIILISVLLALMLAACQPVTPDPTTAQTTPPTTAPVQTKPTTATEPVDLTVYNIFGDLASWYNMALVCQYESPAQLRLYDFFYNGFKDEAAKTDAEWEALRDTAGFSEAYDFLRLPADKMDAVLTEYYGVTLAELPQSCFEGLVYLESTDCYYMMHTDAKVATDFSAVAEEKLADGTIRLTYTLGAAKDTFVVTLKENGDGYKILSNLAA